jgi:hypothetical protein
MYLKIFHLCLRWKTLDFWSQSCIFFLLAVVDKISQDFVSKPPILVTAPALIHSARISTILNVPLSPHVALQLTWVRCQVPSSHRGFQ